MMKNIKLSFSLVTLIPACIAVVEAHKTEKERERQNRILLSHVVPEL
jgi:hypothetical protein